jgi:hypothetical protein
MPQVTQVRIAYSRSKQPAQYESAKAEVEMTIALAEGEELGEIVRQHLRMARADVHGALGITPPPTAAAAPRTGTR